MKDEYGYDAFGIRSELSETSSSHGHYGYTGQEYDEEAGLLYLRARYYDPRIGRFISADPFWGRLEEPASQNRYAYVHNNPLIYADPSGLDVKIYDITGSGGIGVGATAATAYAIDGYGNRGLLSILGAGKFIGYGGSLTGNFTSVDADTIYDIVGTGYTTEASYSLGIFTLNVGADYGAGYSGWHAGVGLSAPRATPYTAGAYVTQTEMLWQEPSDSYVNTVLRDFINGNQNGAPAYVKNKSMVCAVP